MTRRIFGLLVIALVAAAMPALADDKILGKGTLTGTFQKIEVGDYQYFVVKSAGKQKSYFITNHPTGDLAKLVDNPKKYVGRKVRVNWVKVSTNIPEAGGDQVVERVVSVQLL